MPARGIRTEPLAAPVKDADEPADVATERASAEEAGRVVLSGGQVAIVRETTGLDEESVEAQLVKWKYDLKGLEGISYGRILALFGIERLGEGAHPAPFAGPDSETALRTAMMTMRKRDLMLVQQVYDRLNGLGAPVPVAPRELQPNEVYLSDGRIVTIREETALDEQRSNRALAAMGYTGTGLGQISYTRASTLMAIEAIDGKKIPPAQTKAALNSLLRIKARDIYLVVNKHAEVNGVGGGPEAEETFRL